MPLIGFYAGGEIGPIALAEAPGSRATQSGKASLQATPPAWHCKPLYSGNPNPNAVQGFTCVTGIFIVPRKIRFRCVFYDFYCVIYVFSVRKCEKF